MAWPLTAVAGAALFVTPRSAEVVTVVVAVALLFAATGSPLAELAFTVPLSTVPATTFGATATVRVNTSLPTARLGWLQLIVPPAPTAGVVQDQPDTAGSETKLSPAGKVKLQFAAAAGSGPALPTVIV